MYHTKYLKWNLDLVTAIKLIYLGFSAFTTTWAHHNPQDKPLSKRLCNLIDNLKLKSSTSTTCTKYSAVTSAVHPAALSASCQVHVHSAGTPSPARAQPRDQDTATPCSVHTAHPKQAEVQWPLGLPPDKATEIYSCLLQQRDLVRRKKKAYETFTDVRGSVVVRQLKSRCSAWADYHGLVKCLTLWVK